MRKNKKIRVAVVGLGFGAEFVPIYLHHPYIEYVAICDTNEERLKRVGEAFGIECIFTDLKEIVNSEEYDAVHLITPIPLHAPQSVAVLNSGKHCACTVPMATSIEDLKAVINAESKSSKNYMMMETSVYTRQFLFVKEMVEKGEIGKIQLLRGAHYQDMEEWPSYWMGLPPMHYATHAISPLLAIAKARAMKVHCFGSGEMREELHRQYNNPFPIETAIFQTDIPNLAAEVTRSLFHTARAYTESFNIYGEKATFEWPQIETEAPVIFKMKPELGRGRGHPCISERITVPDRADLLPEEIARFTQRGVYDPSNPHLSFLQGGGHHGSHPHLVHEFVMSIIEERKPWIDAVTAATWTAPSICAHESAMKNGESVVIPSFE